MQASREKRLKDAEKKQRAEHDQAIMQNVLQNLNKVDSLKALLGEYESTLHKADRVHESPSRNELETLLRPDECN